jgi:hypothetical protein
LFEINASIWWVKKKTNCELSKEDHLLSNVLPLSISLWI